MDNLNHLTKLTRIPGYSALTQQDIEDIWDRYSLAVDSPKWSFMESLALADDIYLLRDAIGSLQGFAALRSVSTIIERQVIEVRYVLYINLDAKFRRRNLLQRAGLHRYVAYRLRHPFRPVYVMYSASTVNSYLLMPHNLAEYYPRADRAMPAHIAELIAKVVESLGLRGWDAQAAVLRRHGLLRYKEGIVVGVAAVPTDPAVRFYASRNPGQADGDSLLCVFPVTLRNALSVCTSTLMRQLAPHGEQT